MKRVGKRSADSLHGTHEAKPSTGGVWIKRDADAGRYLEAKASGSAFKTLPPVDAVRATTPPRGDNSITTPRKPGRLKGQFTVGPEFFEPMTEAELAEFEGR